MSATPLRVAPPLSVAAAAQSAVDHAPRDALARTAAVAPAPSAPGVPGAVERAPTAETQASSPSPSAGPFVVPAPGARPASAADAFASRVEGATPAPAAAAKAMASVATPARAPQSPATAGNLGGAAFALVLVVGLILLLSWLARRMPGLGGRSANPALSIVGSLALGPRDRLVVVDVGGTQLLLGVGAGGTRTLHTLGQPLPTAAVRATPAFAQILAQQFGRAKP